jgi:NAD dependent epimerase/dehydratase
MNKTCLVTGADGFIGSHLVEQLLADGYQVRALVQYNSQASWGWLDYVETNPSLEIVSGDVRDPFFCRQIVRGMDLVFHLAALIGIPYSYVAPESYVSTNIVGTLNMCQACLSEGVGKLVHTSTSEVYGSAQYIPIDEDHPLQPQSPYSASKIGADSMVMSYFNSFDLPVVIARPFNTFGPRQSARAVLPTIISQMRSGVKLISLGDSTPTRDFNYVADTCKGFILIAESEDVNGQIINIGSNTEYSVLESFNLIKEIMGSDSEIVVDQNRIRPKLSEVVRLVCDNSRIQTLGYVPSFSFREGLEATVEWMSLDENFGHYKPQSYNV